MPAEARDGGKAKEERTVKNREGRPRDEKKGRWMSGTEDGG